MRPILESMAVLAATTPLLALAICMAPGVLLCVIAFALAEEDDCPDCKKKEKKP